MQAKSFSESANATLAATQAIVQLASQTYSKYRILGCIDVLICY